MTNLVCVHHLLFATLQRIGCKTQTYTLTVGYNTIDDSPVNRDHTAMHTPPSELAPSSGISTDFVCLAFEPVASHVNWHSSSSARYHWP